MKVRLAQVTDLEGIAEVNYAAVAQEQGEMQDVHPCGVVPSAEGCLVYWQINLAGLLAVASVVVATTDGDAVIGFALGREEPLETDVGRFPGEIEMLGVLPAAQRHGVGRALMQFVADDLRARGITSLYAWVWDGNDRARGFYESLGAKEIATRTKRCEGKGPFGQHAFGWTI